MRAELGMVVWAICFAMSSGGIASCSAQTSESQQSALSKESGVASVAAALQRSECLAQRDACMSDAVTDQTQLACREQYAGCLTAADDGVPTEIVAAVSGGAQCQREAIECEAAAGDGQLEQAEQQGSAECASEQAYCVAALLRVDLPPVVPETSVCVDRALDCIDSTPSLTGQDVLGACGTELRACAVEAAQQAMPTAVGDALGDVQACRKQLDACVSAAQTPQEIPACTEQEARCIAEGLDVSVPEDAPAQSLIGCTTVALLCTLSATNFDSLDSCNRSLDRCITGVVQAQLTCEERWTECVAADPLLLPICSLELLGCRD